MKDINILEKFINELQLEKLNMEDLKTLAFPIDYKEVNAIENLIAGYKELLEENKGLKIELEIKKYCKVDELAGDLIYYKNLAKEYQGSSIPKSKVKEIIENCYPDIAVQKLYELLEGEN